MSSSPSSSFSFTPGALTHLRRLLSDKTIAFRALSSTEIQLTQRYSQLSDIPNSQQTPPLIHFYSLITRILTHIHNSNLPSIPSLSFYTMSSSSVPSSSSPPHPPLTSVSSPTNVPPLLPLTDDSTDSRTLRRLRRQQPQHTSLSHSTPSSVPSLSPHINTPLFSSLPQSTPRYPSPPLLPQRLPLVNPSSLSIPSQSSSDFTMANFSHSSSPSSFSFSTPPPARTDPLPSPNIQTSSTTTFPITNHPSPPLPPPSTPNYPSLNTQQPLFPLHHSHHSVNQPTTFDILQPDPSHITTDEIQHETHTSGILRTEFNNFPRIPDNQLTERLVTSLLERLAKQLSIDSTHSQNCREAQCIRMLRTSFNWRRLALWLRTYTDKSIHLSYSRTEYWTRLYDQNVHYCHQQQPEQLDLATALQRLTQNLTRNRPQPPLLPTPFPRPPPSYPPRFSYSPRFTTPSYLSSPRPSPSSFYHHPSSRPFSHHPSPRPFPRPSPYGSPNSSRYPPSSPPSTHSRPSPSFFSSPSRSPFSSNSPFPQHTTRPSPSSRFQPSHSFPSRRPIHSSFSDVSAAPELHHSYTDSSPHPLHLDSHLSTSNHDQFSFSDSHPSPSSHTPYNMETSFDHDSSFSCSMDVQSFLGSDPISWLSSSDSPSPYFHDSYYHDFVPPSDTFSHEPTPVFPSCSTDYYSLDDNDPSSFQHFH